MQVRTCEVCGKRSARYVCQECGRKVCEVCLEPRTWICSDCYNRLKSEIPTPAVEAFTWSTPFKLFLLGFLTIVVGMIVSSVLSQVFGFFQLPLQANIGRILGGILFLIGLVLLFLWAYLWSKEYKGQLITHSIYQYLRHPHYLSVILLFNGLSLFFKSIISLILAIYVTIAIARGIKTEEEHLLKQYGADYEERGYTSKITALRKSTTI